MPKSLKHEILNEVCSARALLEDLAHLGLSDVYPTTSGFPVLTPETTDPHASGEPGTLVGVRNDLQNCQRCALCDERNQIVFGVGNSVAELLFVGEAPGREEDLNGEPFVGEAGKLLDKIIRAIGLERSQVYICNVVKCRPPGNRDPLPEEISTCEPFLIRQIAAIQPRLIVSLGRFAAQSLLQSEAPISRLRGKWHAYQGIPLMPTFHPAYLLRNPASKRDVWEDMKQVVQRLRQGDQ